MTSRDQNTDFYILRGNGYVIYFSTEFYSFPTLISPRLLEEQTQHSRMKTLQKQIFSRDRDSNRSFCGVFAVIFFILTFNFSICPIIYPLNLLLYTACSAEEYGLMLIHVCTCSIWGKTHLPVWQLACIISYGFFCLFVCLILVFFEVHTHFKRIVASYWLTEIWIGHHCVLLKPGGTCV